MGQVTKVPSDTVHEVGHLWRGERLLIQWTRQLGKGRCEPIGVFYTQCLSRESGFSPSSSKEEMKTEKKSRVEDVTKLYTWFSSADVHMGMTPILCIPNHFIAGIQLLFAMVILLPQRFPGQVQC
jgi:hypothetical protein